jgi:hypothetical protein
VSFSNKKRLIAISFDEGRISLMNLGSQKKEIVQEIKDNKKSIFQLKFN